MQRPQKQWSAAFTGVIGLEIEAPELPLPQGGRTLGVLRSGWLGEVREGSV